jgi:hypothetical protein
MVVNPASTSQTNVAVIVVCVIAGILVTLAFLGWRFFAKRAKIPTHDEEGAVSPGSTYKAKELSPIPKSEFSPEGKHVSRRFERLRKAFALRKKRHRESVLPLHQGHLPPGSSEVIGRPLPIVPAPSSRHPGTLERQHRKVPRRVPPPPIDTSSSEPTETASSYSISPTSSEESHESTKPLKKVRIAPDPELVPIPGRPLPGFSGAKSARLRAPKSPSRRKSWLSKQPLKHPFVPQRTSDASLKFPPGSPLIQYHPAKHHLEARLGSRTPRTPGPSPLSTPWTPREASRRESLRRKVLEEEGATKQAKLVGALHSASLEGRMTPTGYRGGFPPASSPPTSSRIVQPDPAQPVPSSAYI